MRSQRIWINITDLMAGLMMVFLFIAVSYMLQIHEEKRAITEIALTYEQSKKELNRQLEQEFYDDLPRWGAILLADNTIRFEEPDVLFAQNSAELNLAFRSILEDFFPRYIKILSGPMFKDEIEELRIEGHTSSSWDHRATPEDAYLNNARLSQDRSFNVLRFVYMLPDVSDKRDWLLGVLRANGLSFAKRVFDDFGEEDFTRSRRVELRVITKTEEKIYTILEQSGHM